MQERLWAAAFLTATAWGGLAEAANTTDFMTGVYASTAEACKILKSDGMGAVEEASILTAEGLVGYEYHCDFVEVKALPTGGGWFATAICEEPEHFFPDIASMVPGENGTLHVSFMTDWVLGMTENTDTSSSDDTEASPAEDADESDTATDEYVLCEGVTKEMLK